MKVAILSALAVASVGLIARAQFTPGSGGTYNPPVPPNAPFVPAPSRPQAPTPPSYSWEVPMTPAPQQQPPLQPVSPDLVRVVTPMPSYLPQLSDAQLADLTASIALYPDPILSEMLPSTTYVEELTYADRWLAQHPGSSEYDISNLSVDPSVKAIMHYPSVLTMMSDHLDWTQALGMAFVYQRQDLMESIQRWRRTAVNYGTLSSTPQQDVLQQGNIIYIAPPPRQQVVYVPVYDPAIVYVRPIRPRGDFITFSTGGFSLSFIHNDVDWRDHQVHVPVWRDGRDGRPGDNRPGDGRGGDGRGNPGGRGSQPDSRTVFTRDDFKPSVVYPSKVITPQPDKKVVTLPAGTGPGRGNGGTPPGNARGRGNQSSGGLDNNPNTPF